MRVRHDADELGEGETMILTLADRNILDEHGEVDEDKDELENALVVSSCGGRLQDNVSCPCLCRNEALRQHVSREMFKSVSLGTLA